MFWGRAALEHEATSRCRKVDLKEEEKWNTREIKKVQKGERERREKCEKQRYKKLRRQACPPGLQWATAFPSCTSSQPFVLEASHSSNILPQSKPGSPPATTHSSRGQGQLYFILPTPNSTFRVYYNFFISSCSTYSPFDEITLFLKLIPLIKINKINNLNKLNYLQCITYINEIKYDKY